MAKLSFADSMKKKVGAKENPKLPHLQTEVETPTKNRRVQASRAQKVALTTYVDKAFRKQLQQYCLDKDTTQQQVLIDALNEFFEKRQKAGIA